MGKGSSRLGREEVEALALSLGAAFVWIRGGCLTLCLNAALELSVGHRKYLPHGVLEPRERLRAFDVFRFGLHTSIMAYTKMPHPLRRH